METSLEVYAEYIVAFVKMLSLYNVVDPNNKGRYLAAPLTTALIGNVAKSLFIARPDLIIKTLLFEKKECAGKITYLFQILMK